jgi:SAM-dependent methyltransferase
VGEPEKRLHAGAAAKEDAPGSRVDGDLRGHAGREERLVHRRASGDHLDHDQAGHLGSFGGLQPRAFQPGLQVGEDAAAVERLGNFEEDASGVLLGDDALPEGENARTAGVSVDFRQGDAAAMPFAAQSFDLVVCQAAFKNFTLPLSALSEMHRVLRHGGTAVIQDMSRDATHADIDGEVNGMELGRLSAFTTRTTLEMLRRRAYSGAQFARLAAESPFKKCEIRTQGIGLEVRLTKEPDAAVA